MVLCVNEENSLLKQKLYSPKNRDKFSTYKQSRGGTTFLK